MKLRTLLILLMIPPLFFGLPLNGWMIALLTLGWAVIYIMTFMLKVILPLKQIKDAALHLASGHYDENLEIEGPQEIEELSGALQTVQECLIHESASPSEKLYGEYECAELLQFEMLDKSLLSTPQDLEIKKVSLPSSSPFGLRLIWKPHQLELQEAEQEGFQGIYKLLTQGSSKKMSFDFQTAKVEGAHFPEPLMWSSTEKRLIPLRALQKEDILIFYSTGLTKQLAHPQALKDWFTKILKHFAKDGLALTSAMLENELNFFAKKHHNHEDIHILLIAMKHAC